MAQSSWYNTTGGETIFSFYSFSEANDGTILRFAPVFNTQSMMNMDISNNFGIFIGVAVRNVGFIADDPDNPDVKKKFRTYNLALPVGIKVGNLKGTFVYAGFDVEYAFNYKEKTFMFGDKEEKDVYWFTDRVNQFQYGVAFGVQFFRGSNLKFKYYLSEFFNPDRTDLYASNYERFQGNIFYFSLNTDLFKF